MNDGVTLRLHPDGHWMPNTPGRWRWRLRSMGGYSECEVYEWKGGLMIRWGDGAEQSVRESDPGEWEWVPPAGPTEVTP